MICGRDNLKSIIYNNNHRKQLEGINMSGMIPMENMNDNHETRIIFFRNKDKIIVLLSILLTLSIIVIAMIRINHKTYSSFLVIKDRNESIEAYKISSDGSGHSQKVNFLKGEVFELYASYAVIIDEKGYQYSIVIANDGELENGDKVLVFYSQLRTESIAPIQLEEQYGYIVINDIVSL